MLVVACGSDAARPSASPTAPRSPTPSAPPAARADDAKSDERDAAQAVTAALERISVVRELRAKGPVQSEVLTRVAISKRVQDHIREDVPEAALSGQAELLVALGLTPPDFDLAVSLTNLMSAELAGFYEPGDKTMYLASDLKGAERHATLSHELVHALQDQHYDLLTRMKFRPDEGDLQSAIHALAEGDATSAMLDEMLRDRGKSALDLSEDVISVQVRGAIELSAASANIPSILRQSIIAPYIDGIRVVHFLRRKGGWKAVDDVWRNPPQTTEQILHPEKLDPREMPESIALPAPPSDGPKALLYSDVIGEQGLRLIFAEWMPRAVAEQAASDWGGDRLAVYRDGSRFAVAWLGRWDSAPSAVRGFEALARGALSFEPTQKTDPKASAAAAGRRGRLCVGRTDRGPFALVRRDRDVAAVLGWYDRGTNLSSAGACDSALKWAEGMLSGAPAKR